MEFPEKTITLKDGRSCLLRSPRHEDAAEMLDYLHKTAAETHFLLRSPEDVNETLESEERFIQDIVSSPNNLMIVASVEGKLAGNCDIGFKTRSRNRHRASIAIGLLKEFWNLGIGTAMFEEMISAARKRGGIEQLELEVIEGNERGIALYEKFGFRTVAAIPDAIRLKDGNYLKEFVMIKKL